MKFYIATKLENDADHNLLRDYLVGRGHSITYDWTKHGSVKETSLERITEVAVLEFNGVRDADFVVVIWPGGRGTHVELGMAIALCKKIFFYSPCPEHHEATGETCAFYHHPFVVRSRDSAELAKQLDGLDDTRQHN